MQPNIQNRTFFLGDNLDFLPRINTECVDLIYLDPPFNKKKKFTAPIGSAAEGAEFRDWFGEQDIKDEWVEEIRQEHPELHSFLRGVREMGNSYNYCYLVYMAVRVVECHRILKPTGSVYLHCDHTMSAFLKLLMDCIFGEKQFRNEIVWHYSAGHGPKKDFRRKHDTIFRYSKTNDYMFNKQFDPYPEDYEYKHEFRFTDEEGRLYRKNRRKDPAGQDKRFYWDDGVACDTVWTFLRAKKWNQIPSTSKERTNYPTQKPLALLERIVKASSNKGDLVLDPFCGCVTACIAAEKLGRKWVGIDISIKAWKFIELRLKEEVDEDVTRGEPRLLRDPPQRGMEDARVKKYVYVMSNPAFRGMYKVGIAENVEKRQAQFNTGDPNRAYQVEFKLLTPHYKTLEKFIHRKFGGNYEWVPGKLEEIIQAMKDYSPEQDDAIGFDKNS